MSSEEEEEETMESGESMILFEVELDSASKCTTLAFFLSLLGFASLFIVDVVVGSSIVDTSANVDYDDDDTMMIRRRRDTRGRSGYPMEPSRGSGRGGLPGRSEQKIADSREARLFTRASGDPNEVNHVLGPRNAGKGKKRESGMKFRFRLPRGSNLIPA